MAATFDLTQNPFHLLGVSIRARREEVVEAHEEALANGRADETVLARTQQAILTPRSRIEAELSWFLGASSSQTREILSQLQRTSLTDAHRALERLQGLDKANLAADLCLRSQGETQHVNELLEAYGAFTAEDVLQILTGLRKVSGFPVPDPQQVDSILAALRVTHAKAAVACIAAAERPGEALTEIIETFLGWSDDTVDHLLELIVREYDARTQPCLSAIKERIEAQIAAYKGGGDQLLVEQLIELLAEWDAVSRPVQLLDESKGHEEPRSKEVYGILRHFCLCLANENGRYEEALVLSRALLEAFQELPAAAAQLSQDIDIFEYLAEKTKKSVELMKLLDKAVEGSEPASDDDGIASDFEPKSSGFELKRIPGSAPKDTPPEGASADKGAAPLQLTPGGTANHIRSDRVNADEQGARLWLKVALQKKRIATTRKQGFWGLVIVAVIGFLIYDANGTSSYSPRPAPTTTSTASTSQPSFSPGSSASSQVEERIPPPGSDRMLSRSELRYCIFQGERLDILRDFVFDNEDISRFNILISDYNSRCSSFRYYQGDLQAVEAEVAGKQQKFALDVQHLLASWRISSSPSSASSAGESLIDITTTSGAKLVQSRLKTLGYYAGVADGIWGPASRKALRDFKLSQSNLGYDDRWDLTTQRALMGR